MHSLAKIICPDLGQNEGSLGEISHHLRSTLDLLLSRSIKLKNNGDPLDIALFGPGLARSTLEVATTALVARYDPIRVLAIRRCQKLATYDFTAPNPTRFEWARDVVTDKSKSWEVVTAKDIQRAILSDHVHDLLWREAFEQVLDAVEYARGMAWIVPLRGIQADSITAYMRAEARKLYSELSKGVHSEFVIPVERQFDRDTMGDLFERVWTWVGNLGLIAAHSRSLLSSVPTPLDVYENAQEELQS